MIFLIKKILFNIFSEDRLSKMYWLHNKNVPTDVGSLDFLVKTENTRRVIFLWIEIGYKRRESSLYFRPHLPQTYLHYNLSFSRRQGHFFQ